MTTLEILLLVWFASALVSFVFLVHWHRKWTNIRSEEFIEIVIVSLVPGIGICTAMVLTIMDLFDCFMKRMCCERNRIVFRQYKK